MLQSMGYPPIPGVEKTVSSWDVLADTVSIPEGSTVAILGGGDVGCETGVYLSEVRKCNVQVFEMTSMFATGSGTIMELMLQMQENNVLVNLNAKVSEIADGHITYVQENETKTFECDYVVAALGQKPYGTELIEELREAGFETIAVGDASGNAKIGGAVLSGYNAAHSIL